MSTAHHEPGFIRKYIFSTDHKTIGIQFLFTSLIMLFIGGLLAMLIRWQLGWPGHALPFMEKIAPDGMPGGVMLPEYYNMLFTMHGSIMIFFAIIPLLVGVFGNYLIPLKIGAPDMAFPRLNMISYWLMPPAIAIVCTGFFLQGGAAAAGWTAYAPLSTTLGPGQVCWIVGVIVLGTSSIMGSVNYLTTVINLRAPGMHFFRLPLAIWALFITAVMVVLATPVLASALILLLLDTTAGTSFFLPAGLIIDGVAQANSGGQVLLWQHLFWFYSHPAVYIMILPSMGVISELIACFSRKRIFGYEFVAASSLAIAILGFLVWGHHLFVSGQSVYAGMIFSFLSFLVAIPSAIKVFNWTATMYKGSIAYDAPMLYALGFIGLFTIGGLTGLFLATLGADVHVHDTYFVIAHFHYIMVGGAMMGYLGGLHFWWPKMSGRMYPEAWSRAAGLILFVGFNLTFFPQFILGFLGMPRRYHIYPPEFQVLNVMSSAGASILGVGYLIPLIYLLWSLRYGPHAGPNPWGAKGLEWTTPSPPPPHNFEKIPVVTEEAYAYASTEAEGG